MNELFYANYKRKSSIDSFYERVVLLVYEFLYQSDNRLLFKGFNRVLSAVIKQMIP